MKGEVLCTEVYLYKTADGPMANTTIYQHNPSLGGEPPQLNICYLSLNICNTRNGYARLVITGMELN